jgi:hypothetical protein
VHEPVLAPASCLARGETGGDDCEGQKKGVLLATLED